MAFGAGVVVMDIAAIMDIETVMAIVFFLGIEIVIYLSGIKLGIQY